MTVSPVTSVSRMLNRSSWDDLCDEREFEDEDVCPSCKSELEFESGLCLSCYDFETNF